MIFKPTLWVKNVLSIDEAFLAENNIKALVLDLDNTLSMHGNPAAEEGIPDWLDKMRSLGIKMMVVSNNTNKRVAPLAAKLGLDYIHSGAKPLTFGINKAVKALGVPKENIAVVGDQIFTDVMGGNFAKMTTILVEPFHLEKNILFKIKRAVEGLVFKRDFSKLIEKCVCSNAKVIDSFETPQDYIDSVDYCKGMIQNGNFELVNSEGDINKLKDDNGSWTSDIITFTFKCKKCGCIYKCYSDNYHGKGYFIKEK